MSQMKDKFQDNIDSLMEKAQDLLLNGTDFELIWEALERLEEPSKKLDDKIKAMARKAIK